MASVPQTTSRLMTVEEFDSRPNPPDYPEELVRGRIVRRNVPIPYHGWICCKVAGILADHIRSHDLGYVMSNDSGVITQRGPDTLRGAHVAFYSYAKVPKGTLSRMGYLDVVPDLIIEVRSPGDRWPEILEQVAEHLKAGVAVVGVLDPGPRTLHLYEGDEPVRILGEDDDLALPALLGDIRVAVRRFLD